MSCLYRVLKNSQITYIPDESSNNEKSKVSSTREEKMIYDIHCREEEAENKIKQLEQEAFIKTTQMIHDAQQKVDKMLESAQLEVEEIREKARNEGIQQAKENYHQEIDKFYQFKEELERKSKQQLATIEDYMLELSISISKKILEIEFDKGDTAILGAMTNVLNKFKDEKNLVIELSEENAEKLQEVKEKVHYQVKTNNELGEQEIFIHSDYGTIDASIDKQFENLTNILMEEQVEDDE